MTLVKNQVMNKQKIAAKFNQAAHAYDQHAEIQRLVANTLHTLIIEHQAVKHSTVKNQALLKICDLGCGTGFLTEHLCKTFPDSSILATDIAESMLERCTTKLKAHPQLSTRLFDAEQSPFLERFDLIASSLALQWVENINSTLQRIWQATDKLLCFSVLCAGTFSEWRTLCEDFNLSDSAMRFCSVDQLQTMLKALGAKDMVIKQESLTQHFVNLHAFLRHMKTIGVNYSPHTDQANVVATAKAIRAIIQFFPPKRPFRLSYEVVYCLLSK